METRLRTAPEPLAEQEVCSWMKDALIATVPAFLWASYLFGLRVLVLLAVSVFSALFLDALMGRLLRRQTAASLSAAAVTGAIFTLLLPVTFPLYLVPLGIFVAIVPIKHLFGGLGRNILNPALSAWAVLYVLYPEHLNAFTRPHYNPGVFRIWFSSEELEGYRELSPLEALESGGEPLGLVALLKGDFAGAVGECAGLLLLVGGLYLLVKSVISCHVPFWYLMTTGLGLYLFCPDPEAGRFLFMLNGMLTGNLILGAFFMATDCVTSPLTVRGRAFFGILLGVLTVALRLRGASHAAVPLAILFGNLTVRLIDRILTPTPFGRKKISLLWIALQKRIGEWRVTTKSFSLV